MALDDALIAEIQAADVVVLGVPMYNFGVPAQLKNWIDAIARARVTFRYTERGPEGLLTGQEGLRRADARRQLPRHRRRHAGAVPGTVLGFLGMTDIEFIYAEGLAMGPEAERQAPGQARAEIDRSWHEPNLR